MRGGFCVRNIRTKCVVFGLFLSRNLGDFEVEGGRNVKVTKKTLENENAYLKMQNQRLALEIEGIRKGKEDLKLNTYVSLDKLANAMTGVVNAAVRLVELTKRP